MKITVEDIKGVVGIVPTPATADAERWDATDTVNLPEVEKMIGAIVDAGIEIIMTTGTFGECATLTWPELQAMIDCVVQTTAHRRPVFAGVTTLNTRDTIERARRLLAIGADGLFVGRPMWLPLDDKAIVRYYHDIVAAFPGVPLVVYDNPLAFKGKISSEVYRQLAAVPELVAAKHVGGPAFEADLAAVGSQLRILPLEVDWYQFAKKYPETASACWSGAVACAPSPIAALSDAIKRRDWARAEELSQKVNWACEPMFPGGSLEKFMNYSIQLGHVRFKHAGLIDPGPTRPPYLEVPAEFEAGSAECGRRWKQLEAQYKKSAV